MNRYAVICHVCKRPTGAYADSSIRSTCVRCCESTHIEDDLDLPALECECGSTDFHTETVDTYMVYADGSGREVVLHQGDELLEGDLDTYLRCDDCGSRYDLSRYSYTWG